MTRRSTDPRREGLMRGVTGGGTHSPERADQALRTGMSTRRRRRRHTGGSTARKMRPERLSSYQPHCLSADAWQAGREALLAAVIATNPPTDEMAKVLLTVLCRFMAACRSWDQRSSPDLVAALTDEAIRSFVTGDTVRTLTLGTLRFYRGSLRRIAYAIGAMPRPPRHTKVSASKVAVFFFGAARSYAPFSAVVAAYEQLGHRPHTLMLSGDEDLSLDLRGLLLGPANARVSAPGDCIDTDGRAMAAAKALREAPDVPAEVVSAGERTVQRVGKPASGSSAPRPMGRHAAMKAARAAVAAEERSEAEGPKVVDLPVLDEEIAVAIASWQPKGIPAGEWAMVADATRAAITAYRPPRREWLTSQAGVVARFCGWVSRRPGRATPTAPLLPEELLDPNLVTAYINGPLASAPDPSRATARAVLRRVVLGLSGETPQRFSYTPIQPPYTPLECAEAVALARHQPTAARRRALGAIVALALGAGLDRKEQGPISPRHIKEIELVDGTRALAVEVPGPRVRLVPVRAPYDDLLREVLDIHRAQRRGRTRPLYGEKPTRRNVTSRPLEQAVTATGKDVDLNVARMRSTWLVACMSAPVPLDALLHVAGLRSARTFCDLLPYCPTPDPMEVARILSSVGGPGAPTTPPPERFSGAASDG